MSLTKPTQIAVPFASLGSKNTIPAEADNITGRAGYDAGFPAINRTPKEAGGIPPHGLDFNGIFYDITNAIRYMQAGVPFPYNATFCTAIGGYPKGALILKAAGNGYWQNTVANNTTDPDGGGAGWVDRLDSSTFNETLVSGCFAIQKLT